MSEPTVKVDPARSHEDAADDGVWVAVTAPVREDLDEPEARQAALDYVKRKHGWPGAVRKQTGVELDDGTVQPPTVSSAMAGETGMSAEEYRRQAAEQSVRRVSPDLGPIRYVKFVFVGRTD